MSFPEKPNSPPPPYAPQQPTIHPGAGLDAVPGYSSVYGNPPPNYAQPVPGVPSMNVIVPQSVRFHKEPIQMQCPKCMQVVMTDVTYDVGLFTWLISGALILGGCICGCCLVPFFHKDCKDTTHTCPNCSHVLGHYSRVG